MADSKADTILEEQTIRRGAHQLYRGEHGKVLMHKPTAPAKHPDSTPEDTEPKDTEPEETKTKAKAKAKAAPVRTYGHSRQTQRSCVVIMPATPKTKSAYTIETGAKIKDKDFVTPDEIDLFADHHSVLRWLSMLEAQLHVLEAEAGNLKYDSSDEEDISDKEVIEQDPGTYTYNPYACYPYTLYQQPTALWKTGRELNPGSHLEHTVRCMEALDIFEVLGIMATLAESSRPQDTSLFPLGISRSTPAYRVTYLGKLGQSLETPLPLKSSLYIPTPDDISRVYCLFRAIHPNMEQPEMIQILRAFMWDHLKWTVSSDTIKKVIGVQGWFRSFGVLGQPSMDERIDAAADKLNDLLSGGPKDKKDKEDDRRDRQAGKEIRKLWKDIERSTVERRLLRPAEQLREQNNNVTCRIQMNQQSQHLSSIIIKTCVNYVDKTKPGQPSIDTQLHFDHTNLRVDPVTEQERAYGYEPRGEEFTTLITYRDASSEKDDYIIARLINKKIDFVRNLRESNDNPDAKRYIIQFPVNGRAITTNINTTAAPKDQLKAIQGLRDCSTRSGWVYVIVQDPIIIEQLPIIRQLLTTQAVSDPLKEFFIDIHESNLSFKTLKEPSVGPLFSAILSHLYNTADQWRITHAVAHYYNHWSLVAKKTYGGKIFCIPVEKSFNKTVGMTMIYECSIIINEEDRKLLPKLTKGDSGFIDFKANVPYATSGAWRLTITDQSVLPGLNRINGYIRRPRDSSPLPSNTTGYYMDEPGHMSLDKLRGIKSLADLMSANRELKGTPVTLQADSDDKDMKRTFKGIRSTIRTKFDTPTVGKSKETGLEFLKGLNDDKLPRTRLWDTLDGEVYDQAQEWIQAQAQSHQMEIFNHLLDDKQNIFASMIMFNGLGGGGKTQTSFMIMAPMTVKVHVPADYAQWREDKLEQRMEALAAKRESRDDGEDSDNDDDSDHNSKASEAVPEPTGIAQDGSQSRILDENDYAFLETLLHSRPATCVNPKDDISMQQFAIQGQVLTTTARNSHVDNAFRKGEEIIAQFRQQMHADPHLGVRVHSTTSERNIMNATLDDENEILKEADVSLQLHLEEVDNVVLAIINSNYSKHFDGVLYKNVRDPRVVLVEKSLARRTLELFGVEQMSSEMSHAFTEQEASRLQDMWMKTLVQRAMDCASEEHAISKETRIQHSTILRIVYTAILLRSHHVGCTLSNAQEKLIGNACNFIAIFTDEAGMISESHIAFQFGMYPFAQLRIFAGDLNQTGPLVFGDPLANPFHQVLHRSPLSVAAKRGFPIHEITKTSRFLTDDTLQLARVVARNNSIEPAMAIDMHSHEVQTLLHYHRKRYEVSGTVLMIDVPFANTLRRDDGWISPELIVTAVNEAIKLLTSCNWPTVALISSYKGTVKVTTNIMKSVVYDFHSQGKKEMRRRLAGVTVATTDSFQGHEADVVFYIGSAEGPRSFAFQNDRATVYNSRARYAHIYVQKAASISKAPDRSIIRQVADFCTTGTASKPKPNLYKLPQCVFDSYHSFDDQLIAEGLGAVHYRLN